MSRAEFCSLRGQRDGESELAYFQRMSLYLCLWLALLIRRKGTFIFASVLSYSLVFFNRSAVLLVVVGAFPFDEP